MSPWPRVYELPGGAAGLDMLAGEVFAPVLHVVEFDGRALHYTRSLFSST